MPSPDQFLQANSDTYEWLVRRAQDVDPTSAAEEALARVTAAAIFASMFHPGRFADGAIENIAYAVGRRLPAVAPQPRPDSPLPAQQRRRRVLHVTPLITLGGHSPLIHRWISKDRTSLHSVVLVNQPGEVPPAWAEAIAAAGGDVFVLPPGSHLSKSIRLREIAIAHADVIAWHVIDADVVPIVAFAAPECPPVVIVDHCDHQFWLGSSVADMLVNLRSIGLEETAARRFIPNATVLPIPLLEPDRGLSRSDARRVLGLEQDRILLLSIARGIKFRPCGPFDFVATVGRVLEREPSADACIVGESLEGITPYLRSRVHARLRFVGPVEGSSLAAYRSAADVYLESFPYGSQTAFLEAATWGLPIVPAYAPMAPLLVASDDSFRGIVTNPRDEGEYVERVSALVRNPGERRQQAALLQQRVIATHVNEGWLSQLAGLYRRIDGLQHAPAPIPVTRCGHTPADVGLTRWSATTDARTSHGAWWGETRGAAIRHACYVAKFAGDYRTARLLALRSLVHAPQYGGSWRLAAGALLGPVKRAIRTSASG